MILLIMRGALLLLAMAVASLYLLSNQWAANVDDVKFIIILSAVIGLMLAIIGIDAGIKDKKLSQVSGIFLGLIGGLLATYALSFVINLFGIIYEPSPDVVRPIIKENSIAYQTLTDEEQIDLKNQWLEYDKEFEANRVFWNMLEGVKVLSGLVCVYLGISLVLQTKDDFRFVIPYVEFTKQIRGQKPIVVDSSVIIDGRILDIIETKIVQGTLVVPKFILNELQTIADSHDKLKRARGRRGLDVLKKMQNSQTIEVHIEDRDIEGRTVDQKLLALTADMQGRVMTNDFNLNKVAQLRGVEVININDLSKAMRPVVLPGEKLHVKIAKQGEGQEQGVGYLDDGTMVVVESGKNHVGEECNVIVTSTLQTSAGRMIFSRFATVDDEEVTEKLADEVLGTNEGNKTKKHPKKRV
ncbi:putative PIN and TRAM-domain containing protein precursor [Poriferisphaera corsica]|uniref:Putative PIN and TRAM-domain containing protein n=1 Tax=Poriferisphaera corsica TaxID=2528020 RepID=A0A517YTB1_9BACT|nr:TRAM domain-containing protein [Poriferisphaera corsica]QDU33480.1 putative PIN and TRAM-domain containing protein precursor [Poriferisphaera corsica]